MKLSTGKEVYANGDIFGLTKDVLITEGYDSVLYVSEEDDEPRLTPGEQIEIADEMIKRWQSFKENLRGRADEKKAYQQDSDDQGVSGIITPTPRSPSR